MAVSVAKRPLGFIRGNNNVPCGIGGDSLGAYGFTSGEHGLTTGYYIYMVTPVDSYNGFWYVEVLDSITFRFREYATAPIPQFVKGFNSSDVFFYTIDNSFFGKQHTWNCVHLPIVYKLSNTLWPINSVDTVRDITNVVDSNGYCELTISGDIRATGTAQALSSVVITGCSDDSLNGVWTVLTWITDTNFIINIPFSSATDTDLTTNASIQFYYNNYTTKVQVWGGLNNGHTYYAQKPYDLLTTLDLIPDAAGVCAFSIHEILLQQVKNSNNLLLGTLPNNLDAWTGFFIKYGEEYDDSDGIEVFRSTVTYTSDLTSFEGKAVNSVLPFKNMFSGALSEYVSVDENQKFLTNFERPVIFSGQYFDISFLWEGVKDVILYRQWYIRNVLQLSEISEELDAFYTGVYRAEIEADCDYDRLDIVAKEVVTPEMPSPNTWTDAVASWDVKDSDEFIWITPGLNPASKTTISTLPSQSGGKIKFTVNVNALTGGGTLEFRLLIFSDPGLSGAIIATQTHTLETGDQILEYELEAINGNATGLGIILTPSPSAMVTIRMPTYYRLIDVTNPDISETKTFDINCACVSSKATGYNIAWLNNLGGFDWWYFTGYADQIVDVVETEETEINIFENWPNSYGEFADTVNKNTSRRSRDQFLCRSEGLTLDQVNALKRIKSSPLVQIVNSIYDRTTVIVDADSFTVYREGQQEQYTLSFTCTYTNDIPSQKG